MLFPHVETLADLLNRAGVDAERIRLQPPPGTAIEEDVIAAHARDKSLCELVNGSLIDKAPGYYEARLGTVLGYFLETFLVHSKTGIELGGNAFYRLRPGLVRVPCVSYICWERFSNRRVSREPTPDIAPCLAVEIPRRRNTRIEMSRKRDEYFNAGVELVWQIEPEERTCEVFTSPDDSVVIGSDGIVDGGSVLPGFQLSLREFFARADTGMPPPAP